MPRLPSSRSNRRPQLAQALENAEFSVPDSQPMSDVLRLVENVRQLQEENVALLEQVEELQGELKARDDLLASAREALEQQKADFHNTELSLKESSARDRQQRTEVQVQTAQAKCQSQEADFANTESRLKESIAKQKRKTAEVQVQLGWSKATVKELGGQLKNARESCQSHEADVGKLRREILARENEKKLLQQGRQSVVEENNPIKRDLKATRVALANSQNQCRDQAKGLTELSNQADAKAGQIEAALGIAQFSLKKAKGGCKSQGDELRKMARSRGSWVEQVKRLQDELANAKESSPSQEEEMERLRDALRDSGKELHDAKEWRKDAEGRKRTKYARRVATNTSEEIVTMGEKDGCKQERLRCRALLGMNF